MTAGRLRQPRNQTPQPAWRLRRSLQVRQATLTLQAQAMRPWGVAPEQPRRTQQRLRRARLPAAAQREGRGRGRGRGLWCARSSPGRATAARPRWASRRPGKPLAEAAGPPGAAGVGTLLGGGSHAILLRSSLQEPAALDWQGWKLLSARRQG